MQDKFIESLIPEEEKNEIISSSEVYTKADQLNNLDRAVRLLDLSKSRNIDITLLENTIEKIVEDKKLEISPDMGI